MQQQRGFGAAGCEKFWQLRREFSYALRDTGLTKLNEDIVVPRGRLEDLFRFAEWLQKKHRLPVACFGHAGDGNIHVNVMLDESQPAAIRRSEAALDDLFAQVLAWGGVITGEHGIGLAKKRWWPDAAGKEVRALHRVIKNALDPKDIPMAVVTAASPRTLTPEERAVTFSWLSLGFSIELRSADFSPPPSGLAKSAGSGLKSALQLPRNSLNSPAVGDGPCYGK